MEGLSAETDVGWEEHVEEASKLGGEGESLILVDLETEDTDDEDDEGEDLDEHASPGVSIVEYTNKIRIQKIVASKDRKTTDVMTSYEKAHLVGRRAQEIEDGAKPYIKNTQGLNCIQIATKELEMKQFPLCVLRPVGNGKFERWKVSELIMFS